MTTPNLGLSELTANAEQPHLPVNTSFRRIDALVQLIALSKSTTAPPGSPTEGDIYLIPASGASGVWAAHANAVAYYVSGWQYVQPKHGWLAYVIDEDVRAVFGDGSPAAWDVYAPGGGILGITVDDAESPPNSVALATSITFVGATVSLASPEGAVVTIPSIDLGVPGGAATLDGGGKVPTSQLPSSLFGAVKYKGTWNATSNSPDLPAATPTQGDYYVVSTAGATSLGGITDWQVGDWAIYNGAAWEKVDNTETAPPVTSVAARTGAVVLGTTDIVGVATARFLARVTAGTGPAEEITAAQAFALIKAAIIVEYQIALSDLATVLSVGTNNAYMRAPRAFTLTEVRSSLLLESSSGLVTVDVNVNGATILSTKLTIDANEKTSVTAAAPAVISSGAIADDDLITFDIDAAGTGAKGLVVTLIGHL